MWNNKPLCVLVDDEDHCLRDLEIAIEKTGLLEIEKKFDDPVEFLLQVKELKSQIIFLDMEMHVQGVDVARKLNNKKIIFVSSYDNRAKESFGVGATYFVSKRASDNILELKNAVETALNELHSENIFITISTASASKHEIKLEDLIIVQANKNIHGTDKEFILKSGKKITAKGIGSLGAVVSNLNGDFVQINNSHIVNINFASKMKTKDLVILDHLNEEGKLIELTVGDSYKDDFFNKKPHFK